MRMRVNKSMKYAKDKKKKRKSERLYGENTELAKKRNVVKYN